MKFFRQGEQIIISVTTTPGLEFEIPVEYSGVTLFSGPQSNRSVAGLETVTLHQVLSLADEYNAPLLIEADGSRRHPVKAPAEHEPPIPDFVDTVVVTVGLSALGQPCTTDWVHRPEICSPACQVSNLAMKLHWML